MYVWVVPSKPKRINALSFIIWKMKSTVAYHVLFYLLFLLIHRTQIHLAGVYGVCNTLKQILYLNFNQYTFLSKNDHDISLRLSFFTLLIRLCRFYKNDIAITQLYWHIEAILPSTACNNRVLGYTLYVFLKWSMQI